MCCTYIYMYIYIYKISSKGNFVPLPNQGTTFLIVTTEGGVRGKSNGAEHPSMHRKTPTAKNSQMKEKKTQSQ